MNRSLFALHPHYKLSLFSFTFHNIMCSTPSHHSSSSRSSRSSDTMSKKKLLKRGLPVGQSFIALPSDIAQATKFNDEPATKKLCQTLANDAEEVTVQVPSFLPTLARSAQTKEIRHIASRIPSIPRIVSADEVNPIPRSVSPDSATSGIKLRNTSVAAGRTAPQRYLMSLIQSHTPAITPSPPCPSRITFWSTPRNTTNRTAPTSLPPSVHKTLLHSASYTNLAVRSNLPIDSANLSYTWPAVVASPT